MKKNVYGDKKTARIEIKTTESFKSDVQRFCEYHGVTMTNMVINAIKVYMKAESFDYPEEDASSLSRKDKEALQYCQEDCCGILHCCSGAKYWNELTHAFYDGVSCPYAPSQFACDEFRRKGNKVYED